MSRRRRDAYAKRVEGGLCGRCGRDRERTGSLCEECRAAQADQSRKSRGERAAKGQCFSCQKPKLPTTVRCSTCWYRQQAVNSAGGPQNAGAIRELFLKQGGRCSLTGWRLTPGVNASLDHIVPRSKGGSNAVENLRWIDTRVNSARQNLSDDEFRSLCWAVLLGPMLPANDGGSRESALR